MSLLFNRFAILAVAVLALSTSGLSSAADTQDAPAACAGEFETLPIEVSPPVAAHDVPSGVAARALERIEKALKGADCSRARAAILQALSGVSVSDFLDAAWMRFMSQHPLRIARDAELRRTIRLALENDDESASTRHLRELAGALQREELRQRATRRSPTS